MKNLFALIITMVLLFGFAIGGYISFFRIPLKNPMARVLAFVVLGVAATAITFVVCLTVIWPPVMM